MIIGVIVVVAVLLCGVYIYNSLVRAKVRTDEAWSDITVQLKRRYDLIPNLVETVKGYASHEKEVFEEVARTRAAAAATSGQSPATQAAAQGPFVQALGRLFAVAEN